MNKLPEIVNEVRLFVDGYMYCRGKKPVGNTNYWECKKLRSKECTARAITSTTNGVVTVLKGPNESQHSHPPNREVNEAEKIKLVMKRQAETDPDRPGNALLRENLAGVSSGVLSQLPERENLKQSIRRKRRLDENRPSSHAEDGEPVGNRLLVFMQRYCRLYFPNASSTVYKIANQQ